MLQPAGVYRDMRRIVAALERAAAQLAEPAGQAAAAPLSAAEAGGAADDETPQLELPPDEAAACAVVLERCRQELLPLARDRAAALRAARQALEQQQADRLELAQVAAARACAYLRCANVGQDGGPGAGQGAGSSRCR